jgi:serine/threonine protein kinase
MVEQVAQYRIMHKLGEGGMGVVYAAHDERLDRSVALKVLHAGASDESGRRRLWREARSAAAVNHPNVCQLYEVGESEGQLFIAMELLEGESLAQRLVGGPMAVSEATHVALGVLEALEPLHRRSVVHGDLKPSNIFLTVHGVKLLDFGVARTAGPGGSGTSPTRLETMAGTPHYLAPEQLSGGAADARSDLFALGTVLYEMLSGHRPFTGDSTVEVLHAVLHHEPPPLGGSTAVANVDRVLRQALAKDPERRFPGAGAMAGELRAALLLADSSGTQVRAQPLRRMIVLPFRIMRPDPETDFLAFSLPDAITSSLSSLDSIVMRSSLTAARFGAGTVDLEEVAARADVDIVLSGTLLRAGDQLRVTTQLAEARGGSLVWSQTSQVALGDLFQLQDALTRRIVESLAVPLSVRDQRALQLDVPADPKAYEFYLRANQLALQSSEWTVARDLYLRCLELDPDFAPAWARLGRVHRGIAQYGGEQADLNYERAQQALQRALELNPDLPIAHHLSTQVEIDWGRAQHAMVRLLARAALHPNDAELFAGLTQSCRYCGLLDASIAAHEQAIRLDPSTRTSVNHAYLMRGDYQSSIDTNVEDPPLMSAFAMDLAGRREEAIALMLRTGERPLPRLFKAFVDSVRLVIEGRMPEALTHLVWMYENPTFRDPCALFYFGRLMARAGDSPRALSVLERSVHGGFLCFEFMTRDPWLAPLRAEDSFRQLLRATEVRERAARAAFIEAGGDRILHVR